MKSKLNKSRNTIQTVMAKNESLYTEIVGITGGISIGVVAVIALFASESLWIAAPIVASLSVLGIIIGYLHSKDIRSRKK